MFTKLRWSYRKKNKPFKQQSLGKYQVKIDLPNLFYWFSKNQAMLLGSRLLPLGPQLFSNQIQNPSSHLPCFNHFDHPIVSSHWHILAIVGSIPSDIWVLSIEQTRTRIIIHPDTHPFVEAQVRNSPCIVCSISIWTVSIRYGQGIEVLSSSGNRKELV